MINFTLQQLMQSKHSTSFALPLFTSAVLLTGTMTIWGQEEQGTPNNQAVLQPFLSECCTSCHGEKKQKTKLRFDQLDFGISDKDKALQYQDILDVLNSGEMPPATLSISADISLP